MHQATAIFLFFKKKNICITLSTFPDNLVSVIDIRLVE